MVVVLTRQWRESVGETAVVSQVQGWVSSVKAAGDYLATVVYVGGAGVVRANNHWVGFVLSKNVTPASVNGCTVFNHYYGVSVLTTAADNAAVATIYRDLDFVGTVEIAGHYHAWRDVSFAIRI